MRTNTEMGRKERGTKERNGRTERRGEELTKARGRREGMKEESLNKD